MDFKDNFEIIEEKCENLYSKLQEEYPKLKKEDKKIQLKLYQKDLEKIDAHLTSLSNQL